MRRTSFGSNKSPISYVPNSSREILRNKELESKSICSLSTSIIDFVSEDEIWENQSWRPVRRLWTSPIGVSRYTNRSNEAISMPDDRCVHSYRQFMITMFTSAVCDHYVYRWNELAINDGWEWICELQLDKSRRFGLPDEEGWM